MNLLKLSWKNLTSKPLTMLLSIVLFSLGVALISFLLIVQKQLQNNFEKNLAGVDLVIGAKGSPLQLILSSMYHIDAPTGNISLQEARPFLNPKHPLIAQSAPLSMGDNYRKYRIIGTNPDFISWYEAEIAEGKVWEKNFEVTIGANVAREEGLQIGDEFHSSHGFTLDENLEHSDSPAFRVVGILQPTGSVIDQLILTTTQSIWLTHDHESPEPAAAEEGVTEEVEEDHDDDDHHGHAGEEYPKPLLEEDPEKEITSILVKFKGRNFQALNMQRGINENTDLQAATPAIEINRIFSMMDTGERALNALALVIIFVSGLSIFISLFSSLRDRKYELALMRVMGAGPAKLFLLIILEGLVLAFIGYIFGMLISHGGMEFLAGFMQESYRYSFSGFQFLREEGWLLIAALAIGFIAAVIPAIEASRTDISETLTQS